MKEEIKKRRNLLLYGVASAALLMPVMGSGSAFGQDAADADDDVVEEIVVTGSRIKRDAFSSTTPIEVLDASAAARIGVTSITEMLQKSTAATGTQVDATISTNAGQTNASEAGPAGGAGSANISLRGLGPERTLVLVNGKRLGVAGVRGAPAQPDINMLPFGMVEAVDVLTGGLSTVYGADAVAGVVNVRLKKDYEGITITANTELPEHSGGRIYQISLVSGVSSDRGNITFGLEYFKQERVSVGERDFSSCLRRAAQVQNEAGEVISVCRSDFPNNWLTVLDDLFDPSGPDGIIGTADDIIPELALDDGTIPHPVDATNLIYTPGTSNFGVIGFSTFAAIPQPTDPNINQFPSGARPFALDRFRYEPNDLYNDQIGRRRADLIRPSERFSFVSNGHFDLDWGNEEEFYFESYYFNRQNRIEGALEQIFPTVLAVIPLVDANRNFIPDPVTGNVQFFDNPLNPLNSVVAPILILDDLPQTFDVEVQQIRLVGGITGNFPGSDNWAYDLSLSYDRGTGHQTQPILLENNLFLALQTVAILEEIGVIGVDPLTGEDIIGGLGTPSTNLTCGVNNINSFGGLISLPDCVPFDILNASVVGNGVDTSGTFATAAERDFLVQNRTNRTVTELWNGALFITGDVMDIPGGGTLATAFGGEYRLDKIASQNSAAGVLGLNAAENPLAEGETAGTRWIYDLYAEISAPLVVNASWAQLLQLDAAVRFTKDQNFGSEVVYKVGGLYRPNDWLAFSAAYNTSFRAPNLREQFLADQAGALSGGSDPCHSANFRFAVAGPALDRLIANCALSGADITVLGSAFTVAIPTSTGGAASLKPETSDSFTATVTASQPWSDRFDFSLALTYYSIDIKDTVRALDPLTIVTRCFNDEDNLGSPFCDRVERNRGPGTAPDSNFLSFVRAGFVNTGIESAEGMDISTRFRIDFDDIGGEVLSLNWTTTTNYQWERLSQEFPPSEAEPDGSPIVNDAGRIGNPKWSLQSTVALNWATWDFIWQARWFQSTNFAEGKPNPVITDVNGLIIDGPLAGQLPSDVFGPGEFTEIRFFNGAANPSSQFIASLGPLRNVTSAAGQWMNDISLTKNFPTFSLTAGINNLFDVTPPLIGQSQGPNRNNAVSTAGYDFLGRSFFFRATASF